MNCGEAVVLVAILCVLVGCACGYLGGRYAERMRRPK